MVFFITLKIPQKTLDITGKIVPEQIIFDLSKIKRSVVLV